MANRLQNVVYTDFNAIDDYLDSYSYHSIIEDEYEPPPIIVERSESSLINTSRVAMLNRRDEFDRDNQFNSFGNVADGQAYNPKLWYYLAFMEPAQCKIDD
jgi:hypothetical protein